jgi:hypothetical protein
MNHRATPKVISLQYAIAPHDVEMARIREDPFITTLKAGFAVAFDNAFQLGNLDIELEGPAVAVA